MSYDPVTPKPRVIGRAVAWAVSFLGVAYAVVTTLGLRSLPSPDTPIGDPYFKVMEILILIMAPLMVATMAFCYAYAGPGTRMYALLSLVYMTILAGLSCSVHAVVLTMRDTLIAATPLAPLFVSFTWPSAVYVLDILAWDGFFALSILCAAPVFRGSRLTVTLRSLMIVCGVLSLAGLIGVPLGDMRVRNIGIIGYGLIAPVVFFLLGVVFGQDRVAQSQT